MANGKGIVEFTRKQLYDEIWEISVAGVARKYDLNYAGLIKTCRESSIPFPSSGYWTRRNMGKDVSSEAVNLEGNENELLRLAPNDSVVKRIRKVKQEGYSTTTDNTVPVPQETKYETSGILTFLEEEERNRVMRVACSLEISENARLHKTLIQYKKRIAEYNEKLKAAQSREYYNPRYNKPTNEPEFFKEVSEEGTIRLFSILDSLFKAIEKLGGTINDDLSVKIRNDIVRIRVAEGKDKINHQLTKEEAQALVKYQDEVKRHSWASKPQIRQYDYVYNGRIRILLGERSCIRDSEKEKLENRLGDILISLYEKSEENRIDRERREEEQRIREEEARKQEELCKRKETEIEHTKSLVNKAEDYRIALEIRAYIDGMVKNVNSEATSEWIEWARQKADWFDPTIAREDEYLGKRNHEKDKEDKELDKMLVRRSWFW